jgi:hypothetical protein
MPVGAAQIFVRWNTRALWRVHKDSPHRNPGTRLSAVLVHSESVEGKLREILLARLGHIKEEDIDVPEQQLWFWNAIDRHLDALSLSPEERLQIEEQICERIPRPTPEEVERDKKETLEKLLRHFGRL